MDYIELKYKNFDYIIDEFVRDRSLLEFISKNLSYGLFGGKITNYVDKSAYGILQAFKKGIKDNNLNVSNPEVTLSMIVELTSSVVFTSITMNRPLPIVELKPVLYDKIKKIILD